MGHQQAARTRPRPARADRGGTAQEAGRRGTRGPVREKGLRSTQARSRRAAPPEESSPGGPEKDAPRSGTPDRPAGGSLAQSGPDQVLLETIAGIGLPTDPDEALRLAVAGAMTVTGARYGALGLIGEGGRLAGFIPVGMSKAQIARLPRWPEGRGLLGELTRNPRPIRLADLSAHPAAEGFPARHPRMHSLLAAPVLIRDEMFGTIFLADKRWPDADAAGRRGSGRYGAAFDASDEAALVAVAGAAGLAVENARLRADARRRDRWQQATAEVTHRLLSASDPREVLGLLVQHALEISGADAVALAEPDASGDYISVTHAAGSGTEALVGVVIPAEQSLTAVVLKSGQAMRVDEYSTDPRIAPAAKRVTKLGPAVVVPLGVPGDVRGVMVAARQAGAQALPPAAMEMVTTFAVQAGIGLKLAGLRRDAQQIALLADRDRIARDLHDLVIQRLFATGMSLQGALPLVPDPGAADRVSRAVDELDGTIQDIRAAIYTLQSRDKERDDQPGLQARITAVAEDMTAALGFAPWLRIDGPVEARVPPDVAEDVLAVVREGLANAARHAWASRVDVVVMTSADLSVVVQDDGVGIPPGRPWSGLANLTHRAAELGGSLDVVPGEAGGTRLVWRVPLPGVRV